MKNKNNITLNITTILAAIVLLIGGGVKAQESNQQEIKIKTSAVCDDCKERIEMVLAFEKGVKKSSLDLETQLVSVFYNPEKTTPEKIRLAISKSGYDADEVKAKEKAYNKLPACCKQAMKRPFFQTD